MAVLETDARVGWDQQGRGPARLGPLVAARVEAVVDPGQGTVAGVVLDRGQLPVGGAEPGLAVEGEVGQAWDAEDARQVVVGAILPAGGVTPPA